MRLSRIHQAPAISNYQPQQLQELRVDKVQALMLFLVTMLILVRAGVSQKKRTRHPQAAGGFDLTKRLKALSRWH